MGDKMKKYLYIFAGLILLLLSTAIILFISSRHPDNFLYDFGGYYKNNQILTMYESNNHVYALVRNHEITVDNFDDDDCWDDMLNIVVIDDNFNLIELIEIEETQTLENDGQGIRTNEFSMSSYQDNDDIYISISLYDENYMIKFDTLTNTYVLNETEMHLQTFIIVNDKIKGVGSVYNNSSNLYDIIYYELSQSLIVENEILIGDIDNVYQKPLINSDFIFVQGDLNAKSFSWNSISRYNISTQSVDIIADEDSYNVGFQYINQDNIIYSIHHIENENIIIEYYDEDGALIQSSTNDEFPILSIDNSRFIFMQRDVDFQQQIIRILDQDDNEEIVLEFDQRMYLYEIYYFNDSVYLIADMIESDLDKLLFGSHQAYIIKYSVSELNALK